MEIKQAIKEIREGSSKTYSSTRNQAILTICQALHDGYELCKVDECIDEMKRLRDKQMDNFIKYKTRKKENLDRFELIDECIDIVKEACE